MEQITVLDKNNQPIGPFTRTQIAEKLQNGQIALADLAFVPGLAAWTPLRDVLARIDPPGGISIGTPAAAPQAISYSGYAGFWLRVAAYFIDTIIIEVVVLPIALVAGFIFGIWGGMHHVKPGFVNYDGTLNVGFVLLEVGIVIFSMTFRWLYFALQESSAAQATLGKRLLGLRVTDLNGQRISMGRATGRFFGKIISGLILCVGFMMAGFTERKQALHDIMAGTLVVRT